MIDAVNEGTLSVTSMVNMIDVLDPTSPAIYRELAGGVTTINVLHGSANTIGGQTVLVKLRLGYPADSMIFPGALPGIKFALGENVTQKTRTVQPGQERRYPFTRMGQEEVLRDAFTRAQDYKATWDAYNARRGQGRKKPRTAAQGSRTRAAGADPRTQAHRQRALVPHRRDADAGQPGQGVWIPHPVPARPRGLQDRQRARGGRRHAVDLRRRMGLQDRSRGRHSV